MDGDPSEDVVTEQVGQQVHHAGRVQHIEQVTMRDRAGDDHLQRGRLAWRAEVYADH